MKKVIQVFTVIFVFILLVSCQSKNKEPIILFKDENKEIILTNLDLTTIKVVSFLDSENKGTRGLYIEFKNKDKLEQITTKNLNKSIQIYCRDQLITTQYISHVIKGNNLGFNEMNEGTLKQFENILNAEHF
ncbi:hypothetical protein D7Z26_10390 [Cohnella endophytica]|uniref:Lipoprotein n=1 Tax=Cohnella endophytica TaxID=2419778 RepID=A0A494XYJ6_9BACL|nr:hypothetical protein [Cohnella endophytica]RKP55582.1 hypothetical protein D7Z26_10390 [Cohnella endophytica]